MRTRLIDRLNELRNNQAISMHVPGHKNNTIGNLNGITIEHDKTEIHGLDNLHEPEEILQHLNQTISQKYDNYTVQILTNGSTTGIIAAILSYKDTVNRYFVVNNAHKSVYHGIELANHLPTLVDFDTILKQHLNPNDVVIVTYPTYEGSTKLHTQNTIDAPNDIQSLIKWVHSHNGKIIVDEAHGAHFDITPNFPKSSMNYNADIVIQSYHKMLPSLTMASVVFSKDKIHHRLVMKFINFIETSSPSYLVMASIESAHEFYTKYNDKVFFKRRQEIIENLTNFGCIVNTQDDPTKLIITHRYYTPYELEQAFLNSHIYPEMTTDEGVLFILPLSHTNDTYPYELLYSRLSNLSIDKKEETSYQSLSILMNKTCIQHIIPYPPGIPLVRKDEIITEEDIKRLIYLTENRVKIEGITSNLEYYKDRER